MKNMPITWKRLTQACWRLATSIGIVVTPRFCNFKSVEWNPGEQAMNQVNFRGLSTKVNVANTPKYHQLAPNASLWCGYRRNRECNMEKCSQRKKTRKQGIAHYACAMTKLPVTCNRFNQAFPNLATGMSITPSPCFCNFNSIEWNPGIQAMIQVNLRGLSPKLSVANTPK